jgi:Family of unknown function (DUF6464)
MTHYCFNQEIPFDLLLDEDDFDLTRSLEFMRSRVIEEMPLDAPQIRVTWKWWISPHHRHEELPTLDEIQRAIRGIHRWDEWQTVRIEVRAVVVMDDRDRQWREEVTRRVFRPAPAIENLRIEWRGVLLTAGGSHPTIVPNAEHLENQSRLKSCRFNARSPYIKCAVNPTVECRECTHYEAAADAQ